jgi:hypothetical protein
MLATAFVLIAGLQISFAFGLIWFGMGRLLSGRPRAIATSATGVAFFLGLWADAFRESGLAVLQDWKMLCVAVAHLAFAAFLISASLRRAAVHERELNG